MMGFILFPVLVASLWVRQQNKMLSLFQLTVNDVLYKIMGGVLMYVIQVHFTIMQCGYG